MPYQYFSPHAQSYTWSMFCYLYSGLCFWVKYWGTLYSFGWDERKFTVNMSQDPFTLFFPWDSIFQTVFSKSLKGASSQTSPLLSNPGISCKTTHCLTWCFVKWVAFLLPFLKLRSASKGICFIVFAEKHTHLHAAIATEALHGGSLIPQKKMELAGFSKVRVIIVYKVTIIYTSSYNPV